MQVKGKIKLIGKTETFGTNGFRKRNLVITTDDQYPQDIQIELHQDKTDILDKYKIGDSINVSINLRGREWINPQGEAKYFNSIVGWRIELAGSSNDSFNPKPSQKEHEPQTEDLPF